MSWVIASTSNAGITGNDAYERQRIRIDLDPAFTAQMTDGTHSYLFITYDVGSSCAVQAGGFQFIDTTSAVVSFQPTAQQTGGLFRASGTAGVMGGQIVLRLVLQQREPVKWRAITVIMRGDHVSAEKVVYNRDPDGTVQIPLLAPYDPKGGTPAKVMFFGYSEGAPLEISPNATPVKTVTHSGQVIASYTWSTAVVESAIGGPWFTASATATVPLPEKSTVRPPPTKADDFWAIPALCEVGDFFIINNDLLSQRWDEPGSTALDQGDSVVFNTTDSDGTRWSITDVQGWWTLPPVNLPDLPNSGYLDGSFPVDGRYNAREITVSGAILPGPNVSLAVPRQRLLRALDAVRGGALFVAKEPVWAKQCWVYLSERPGLTTADPLGPTIFDFKLKAVDPIKYHAGTVGFQQHTLVEASQYYKGRTYSTEKKPREIIGNFLWNDATDAADPGSGLVSSTGASFDDDTQTVCLSATSQAGAPADLSQMVAGDAFRVNAGALVLDGIVQGIVAHTSGTPVKTDWWEIAVNETPGGLSTPGKPTANAAVSVQWLVRDQEYTEEAMVRGMRFRPLVNDDGTPRVPDPKDVTLAPNQYRQYEDAVMPAMVEAINAGTATVRPRVYIYGPCVNPAVINVDTKEKMQFMGSVEGGEVLVADCQWRIVSLRNATAGPSLDARGDLEGVSRRWMLDFSSDWLSVIPGENRFMMSAASLGEGSKIVVTFRSGWMG